MRSFEGLNKCNGRQFSDADEAKNNQLCSTPLGIVFADGPSWNSTRRVALKYLKTFGYGTASMEALITEECSELIKLRMQDAGEPIEMDHMFDIPVVNILWRIVAGKR